MKEKIFEINQVDIYPDIIERTKLGNYNGLPRGSIYLDTHGQQTAIFIGNNRKKEGTLEGIRCFLSKKGNISAPLRFHVYSVDTCNKRPCQELLPQMIVVKPDIGKGWMNIDLRAFEIKIPVEGIFIAVEGVFPDDFSEFYNGSGFIPDIESAEETEEEDVLNEIAYGQRIGYNNKGKNNTWHYSITRTWFKVNKKRFNVMMAADVIYRQKKKNNENYTKQ